MSCPANSIIYNGTKCACPVGYLLNRASNSCVLFADNSSIVIDNGIDSYSIRFPATIFEFDSIRNFTQSQAVFLESTLIMLLSWLVFCFFLRFTKLGNDGKSLWFKIRWWISRLDVCFATRHWLEDQKVVKKRKTELGGTFSIASWILFVGLFAALLYQIISKRTIEVHNVRATNAPDLTSFINDMEFNITTISSMSCANLRNFGTLVTGNPGFDYKVVPLSNFGDYSCQNTSSGPTITLKCNGCRPVQDNMYISWQFVDLPNNPAAAVGFQFNLSTKNHINKRHLSFVSGTLKNGSSFDDRPVTFRGRNTNILKFNLFPRIYHNLNDLKLIQPLFHDFVPGSLFHDTNELRKSLENSIDGMLNTTLFVNLLSDYIVEIDNKSILGPVSFLADLGGLYCISIIIFFYLLVQCEYRIKKLRNEDSTLRKIRYRRKALDHWDKLRKYVMYTYGCSALENNYNSKANETSCGCLMVQSANGNGSSHKTRKQSRNGNFSRKATLSSVSKESAVPDHSHPADTKIVIPGIVPNLQERLSDSIKKPPLNKESLYPVQKGEQSSAGSSEGNFSHPKAFPLHKDIVPPPPLLELADGPEMSISDLQKNLKSLYEYNVMLRESFVAVQNLLHAAKSSSAATEQQT